MNPILIKIKTAIIKLTYPLFLVIITTSCIKKDTAPCPQDFVVYGYTTPYDSVYHVGDTLTFVCDFGNSIYERKTNNNYVLDGLNIEFGFGIYDLDTISGDGYFSVDEYVEVIPNNNYNYYIQKFSNGSASLFSNVIV